MSKRPTPTQIEVSELVALRRSAQQLRLKHRRVRAAHNGGHLSRLRGRGMEFDDVRAYQAGDDVRHIDWGITARTGEPHTKLYREERERPVLIACDFSADMQFATRGDFKSVCATRIAALLAWAAHLNGDRVGALLFDEHQHLALKPQRGDSGVLHLFNKFKDFCNKPNANSQVKTGFNNHQIQPLDRLRRLAPTGSLVCLISDFSRFDRSVQKSLQAVARHCELILIQVNDPIEAAIPERGRLKLLGPDGPFTLNCTPALADAHQRQFEARQEALQSWARQYRAHYAHCFTHEDAAERLRQQLEVRRL